MNAKIKVLIIEDSEDDVKLMLRELNKSPCKIIYKLVEDSKGLEKALQNEWDVIISDYSLPGFNGYDALIMCNEKGIDIPFIIVSGTIGEETAVSFMKSGARDYIMKKNLARLLPAIEREISGTKIRKEKKQSEMITHLLAHTVKSISEMVTITDLEDKITFVNQAFIDKYGYSYKEIIGKHVKILLSPDNPSEMLNVVLTHSRNEGWNGELLNITKDGRIFPISLRTSKIFNENREIIGLVGIAEDITERKIAEMELYQSRNDWENTFDTITDMITIHDEDYNIIRANKAAKIYLGLPELDKIFEAKCFKYYHGDDNPPEGCPSCDCLKTGFPGLFELFEPHLKLYLEIRAIPRFDINNRLIGLVHVVRDITIRKLSEDLLKSSEEKYRNLIETMPVGFYRSSPEGNFVDANPALVKMLGYESKEELMKIYIPEALYFSENDRDIRLNDNENYISNSEIYRLKKKDGSEIWVDDFARYIKDSSGKTVCHEGFLRDVTEFVLSRNAMMEAKDKAEETSRLKSSFLANMSHEIRIPLSGILGFANILKEIATDETQISYADIIEKNGQRLLETLDLILNFAKLESEKQSIVFSNVNIEELISETIQTFSAMAEKKNIFLKQIIKTENLVTKSDERFIRQILNNLVNNAIKFTNRGSVIVELSKENLIVVIKVKDTGIGIANDKRDFIFDDFRQESEGFGRNFEGTGLGLAITKRFTEMLKGKIHVESELGKGSVFTVELPYEEISDSKEIKKDNTELDKNEQKAASVNADKLSILIVEDDEYNRLLIKTILSKYDIDSVSDGPSAIQKASEKVFDIILMDINLGKGMDGIAATKEIRKLKNYEKIPIVALTAFVLKGDKEEFLNGCCTHYLGKPFSRKQLLDLINEITTAGYDFYKDA